MARFRQYSDSKNRFGMQWVGANYVVLILLHYLPCCSCPETEKLDLSNTAAVAFLLNYLSGLGKSFCIKNLMSEIVQNGKSVPQESVLDTSLPKSMF